MTHKQLDELRFWKPNLSHIWDEFQDYIEILEALIQRDISPEEARQAMKEK